MLFINQLSGRKYWKCG